MLHDDAATRPLTPPDCALGDVAEALDCQSVGDLTVRVHGISLSSQRVRPGDLYAALPGTRVHGVTYLADALERGAVGVLTDPAGAARAPDGIPVLVHPEPRRLLGMASAKIYGHAAEQMQMIGITGTQGKTTTTRLLEAALESAGVPAAVVGTVGTRIHGRDVETSLTTPEAPDLHGLFARMAEEDVVACAMEVSSHALVMGRVDGVVFDVAVFTNFGRDHLDFHRDVEEYFQAKASLFTPEHSRLGLVNVDDAHGRRLARDADVPIRTFSSEGAAADWRAEDVELTASGSSFTVVAPDGARFPAGVPLAGDFNVANALAAIAAAGEAGLDAVAVARSMRSGAGVPGRLERVDAGQPFEVVVDYAHKPDAVRAAIEALRPLTDGRVIVVIGAGGDRDAGKRPLMGRIAADLADVVIVTDDNPRTEDPAAIRAAVLADTEGGRAEVFEQGDRRAAIREAVRRARPGDIVLIAGKGHETGQEIDGVKHPFDDRIVVTEEIGSREERG